MRFVQREANLAGPARYPHG